VEWTGLDVSLELCWGPLMIVMTRARVDGLPKNTGLMDNLVK
jgi:hypothetical protein